MIHYSDIPAAQIFYYEIVKYISARVLTKESINLWGSCTTKHISLISSLWALINLGERKFDNIKTLSEVALMSWSLLAIEAHESDVTSKEHIINNVIRFIIVTSSELALVSKHVGISKLSKELPAEKSLFEENMFIPMVISYIERLSDNPVENRTYIEAAVSLPDVLLVGYDYDISDLSDNDWLRFNKAIEKLNNYSVVEEGKPFFLPISYYWAWVHHVTPEDMINEVFNFELQLASICFDSFGCDLNLDTDSKNYSWYFNNKFYSNLALTALERCDFEIAESIILIILYRSLSEGVALEPWKETANAIVNVINDSNEEFSKFVWNLLDAYEEKLHPENNNTLLRTRLRQIKDKCRFSMQGDRSLKLISQKLVLNHVVSNHSHTIEDVISSGEGDGVEFKSTLRVNLHSNKIDLVIEHAVLKTIAAFLNSNGGILYIGINDEGQALGLDSDNFPNADKMMLYFKDRVKVMLGKVTHMFIRASYEPFQDKKVLVVKCRPSTRAVFLKNKKDGEEFFTRNFNSSEKLEGSNMIAYIDEHFNRS